jgi:hypothetical protein
MGMVMCIMLADQGTTVHGVSFSSLKKGNGMGIMLTAKEQQCHANHVSDFRNGNFRIVMKCISEVAI